MSEQVGGLQDDFFATFLLISTGGFILFLVPMEPWFVTACAVDLQAGVDQSIWN